MFKIEVNEKNENELIFSGEFDLGIIGKFKDHMVNIDFDIEDYREDPTNNEYELYKDYLELNMTSEEIAAGLTKYFKHKQNEIKEHIEEINERLLIFLFNDMIDTDFEFWIEDDGYPDFIIPEKMPQCEKDNIRDNIYTHELFMEFGNIFYDEEVDLDCGEVSIREFVNKNFPMIDLDKLIKGIFPTILYLGGSDGGVSFQCCSKDCNYGIACEAYASIGEDFRFYNWTNF